MNTQEIIAAIALTKLKGLSLLNARTMLEAMGSASEVFAHRKEIVRMIPDASQRLVSAFADADEAMKIAEEEVEFIEKKRLKVFTLQDEDYPQRLRECEDAPLVLYGCGNVNLNSQRIISVVGTRKCSEYGREVCNNFIADLKRYYPDTLIVSGLAYGIDVCAHRAALENGMATVGVLAHGLDTIYPSMHRQIAADMVHQQGGLLTEYTTHTTPEKGNFVRRNRIVAGLCDACIVVESSERGGSLITAELAMEYNRDVFAFPGRAYDEYSRGCNNLIRRQQATLLTCAADLLDAMGWENPLKKASKPEAIQQELFPDLTDEERALVNTLKSVDDKHINQIAIDANIPYSRASMILFDLEMKGVVKALGGARYKLIHK
ncbi:MAG: DNA-processing protein DprA [Bacteroidaceae bacterium]|nr:DNA-processing protein DprA [Bacteroidaceae bacterium]MBO4431310.1 DNA-processing protein DprA [Bacteroidaceae bacterium]